VANNAVTFAAAGCGQRRHGVVRSMAYRGICLMRNVRSGSNGGNGANETVSRRCRRAAAQRIAAAAA